jgi:hypothetical protein
MAQEHVPLRNFIKKIQQIAIFVQIFPYLTTNEIKYVLYDGIIF